MVVTTYRERLNEAMAEAGIGTGALASALGLSYQAVRKARDGATKSLTAANNVAAAAVLGVSAEWLATGDGEKRPQARSIEGGHTSKPITILDNPEYPAIPLVTVSLSAGVSGFQIHQIDDIHDGSKPIVFRRDWYTSRKFSPDKLLALRVNGASMETSLWDGDLVVINTADTEPEDGAAFAANYEGELVIKRLVRDGGQWWLSSDNQDQRRYPRKLCDERVFILGRVVHKQSERI